MTFNYPGCCIFCIQAIYKYNQTMHVSFTGTLSPLKWLVVNAITRIVTLTGYNWDKGAINGADHSGELSEAITI